MPKNPPDLMFIPAPSGSKKEKEPPVLDAASAASTSAPKVHKPKREEFLKNRMRHVKEVTAKTDDLDQILSQVTTMEEICSALKCKVKVRDFAINCQYCKSRFCTAHYLPEVHGCGEAVKKDYKQKYLHPGPEKLPKQKKEQAATKLQSKLKEMQNSRKKTNTANTSKGKK